VSTKITAVNATDPAAKAGIMLRATTDPGSAYYAAYLMGGNLVVQLRTDQGATAIQIAQLAARLPVFVQVSRSATDFTAATSSDGKTWTPIPGSSFSVPGVAGGALAGLAVTSHDYSRLSTATFDSVAIG
jgi:hypothetical protein